MFPLLVITVAAQFWYALYFYVRVLNAPPTVQGNNIPHRQVSVIICAKNEARNLEQNLPLVLDQQYHGDTQKPLYEVIVVNDASDDDTATVMQRMEQRYDNLWDVVITPGTARDVPGKKYALGKGADAAKHDTLLLIDADCAPASNQWLAEMMAGMNSNTAIVAGYGGYKSAPGLLNAFVRWETMHTFLQYSTYAITGQPYMAVGRNMICTRAALRQAQKSKAWRALPSGDDDLLVSVAGNKDNVAVVSNGKAFTYTEAKRTWKEWAAQKQRHLSTGKYYTTSIKLLLGGYGASHAAMWLLFFFLLGTCQWHSALTLMSIRCALYWSIWWVTANRLQEKKLFYLFPLFDIGWMVYNFAFLPYITWKNKQKWT